MAVYKVVFIFVFIFHALCQFEYDAPEEVPPGFERSEMAECAASD